MKLQLFPKKSSDSPEDYLALLLALITLGATIFQVAFGTSKVQPRPRSADAPQSIAFVNVNVVPFDRERILEGQTVIVRDGRIAQIGPASKIKVPAGALKIDGRGKYLMPGLADMHAHLSAQQDLASQQLQLFLANGVTTVRNMIGKPEHLLLRDRVAKGELPGPTIYTAGPPLLGNTCLLYT